ncbi:diguanylate cyclase [Paractinoplanes brasiliensis]|uniref:diguanylate cyclase n=1 Tax=Paractinoplanes brasiliensis TaxID=52695 RepID=UPI0014150675|nr:diguanylate cyclase [Actinoplanes brasiliensis]GID32445.1 hypothetical protein Abr02nite_74280 [Actinoplanes brasiliensis]
MSTQPGSVSVSPPEPFPGLRLLGELGRGAGSVVHRADRNGHEVAVKVVIAEAGSEEAAAFVREAALSASLRHPGLPAVHEVGTANGRPYIVMQLIDGRPLGQVIRERRYDGPRTAELGAQIVDVLGVAHRAGLVHRDVKPDNILVRADGRAWLIDLGLAARAGARAGDDAAGTFLYSAPEQTGLLRRPVDGRADLYALGVVLFECLSGAPPFRGGDTGELMRLHLTAPVPDVRESRPEVSAELAAVIRRLMAKDPDDRYASAEEARRDLARLAGGDETHKPDRAPLVVGRAGPRAELLSCWEKATDGSGGAVLVTGGAGLGKARLAAELAHRIATDHPVLEGAATAEGRTPLGPLIEAVDRYVAAVAALPEPRRAAAIATISEAAGSASALLTQLVPALGGLLPGRPVNGRQADLDQDRVAEIVAVFLTGLATASGGALLHLRHAQWWDPATLNVVGRLAVAAPAARLLVLVTARDDDDGAIAAALGLGLRTHITLGPLGPDEVAALIAATLGGGAAPPSLTDRLISLSDGNPLAVVEYVRRALEAGVLLPSWGGWVVDQAGLDDLRLPADLLDLMLRRVGQLSPQAQEPLVVAAAIGARFAPELVAEVLGRRAAGADGNMPHALAEALALRLVEPVGSRYAFPHERIRQALLDRLDPAERRGLHQLIAETIEQTAPADTVDVYTVAHHYLHGETGREPYRLFRAAAAAGRRALAEYDSAQACFYFERAEEAATRAGIEPDAAFHASFGLAASRVGQHEIAQAQAQRALDKEPDPNRRGILFAHLTESYHTQWDGSRAMEMARRGLDEIDRQVPANPAVLALTSLGQMARARLLSLLPGRLRLSSGHLRDRDQVEVLLLRAMSQSAAYALRLPESAMLGMRVAPLAVRLGTARENILAKASAAMTAETTGRAKRGARLFAEALAEAEALGDPTMIANIHLMRALATDGMQNPHERTGELFRAALTAHGQWLPSSDYLLMASSLGLLEVLRGELAEATRWYGSALRRVSAASFGNPAMALGASVAALAGDPAEAAKRLHDVREFAATEPGNLALQVNYALTATQVAVEQGDLGESFEEAVAAFKAIGVGPRRVFAIQRSFWIFQAYGRLGQAASDGPARLAATASAVAELRRVARGSLYEAYATVAEAWLDQLNGRPEGALRRLAPLAASATGHRSVLVDYEAARVRARALTALGRPHEARRQAEQALALADEYGWRTRARWAREEFGLTAAGTVAGRTMRSHRHPAGNITSNVRRLEAVYQISLAASAVLEPRQVCRVALDETLKILAGERAFLFLADEATGELLPFLGRDADHQDLETLTGYGASLVQRVRDTATALVVTGSDQGAALGSQSTLVHGLRSIIAAPVCLRERLLGVVYLDSRVARGIFTADDVEILSAITHHVAVTFETARAAQLEADIRTAQRERDLAETLRLAIVEVGGTLDPEEVLRRMIAMIGRVAPVDSWSLLLQDENGSVSALGGIDAGAMLAESGSVRRLLRLSEPLCGAEPDLVAGRLGAGTAAWMALPLLSRGRQAAVLLIGSSRAGVYSDSTARIAATLAGQGITAYENARLFRQVGELAARDGLTGLYNRRHFMETATTGAGESGAQPIAAAMVDIDFFKKINDTYGHGVGDEVIREVADRLSRCLRAGDIICRYGGEEFAVLLTGASAQQAEIVARRLHAAVGDAPIVTEAGALRVTVSVGVTGAAHAHPEVQRLLDTADQALYDAKRSGRDRVRHQPVD